MNDFATELMRPNRPTKRSFDSSCKLQLEERIMTRRDKSDFAFASDLVDLILDVRASIRVPR